MDGERATLRLDGPGSKQPPLKGPSQMQDNNDIIVIRKIDEKSASSQVQHDVFYQNKKASASKAAKQSVLLQTPDLVCRVLNTAWYDISSTADKIEALVERTFISSEEAGRAAEPSYFIKNGCSVISTKIESACVRMVSSLGVNQSEYRH